MNKNLYRLVFSKRLGMLVAVSEVTARQGKAASGEGGERKTGRVRKLALAIALALAGFGSAYANPVGGVVTAGSGKISQNGSQMTINQGSQNLAVNWQSFNINANESVVFNQPGASSIALNRVIGTDGSKILGHLDANGQVFLINPNGVLFGKGAQVSTGGLVASTLNLSDADFLAGKRTFSGASHAGVTNQGTLNAHDGGYVALLGNQVSNQGVITAKLGSVGLAAGSQVTLDLAGDQLLDIKVDQAAYSALAENHGLIKADGGQVVMTASAHDALLNTVVNNDGVIQAQTVENQGGVIKLLGGETGTTVVDGRLDASAPQGGNGGSIETSGAHVKVADSAQITTAAASGKTGQWLVDPADFTVAAAGGDITGATLSSELNANNVTLQSSQGTANTNGSGNINVNDNVNWGANTTLTLQSVNDINLNRNITATGDTAGLVLSPGSGRYTLGPGAQVTLSGATPSLAINGNSYTLIKDVNALQNMSNNLSGNYALATDVDASATSTWNSNAGFNPVGGSTGFAGRFDGLGHTISSLVINRPFSSYDGLFGSTTSSTDIRNVGLVGGSVTGSEYVGDLVGANRGAISNSYATGTVNGQPYTYNTYTTHCGWFGCTVTATPHIVNAAFVGGLAGYNTGTISNSYATGSVNEINSASQYGNSEFGGLVGRNDSNGVIRNSYATSAVSGSNTLSKAGGLVGGNYGTIGNSYAVGSLSIGGNDVGGLAGDNAGSIATSYATGSVTGAANVGGLVGFAGSGSTINNSYASGSVSGTSQVNGLVGYNAGTITNSVALTADQMKDAANFSGFDFSNTWRIYEGHTTPLLLALLKPLTITANNAAKTYDGTVYQGNNGLSCGDVSCADSHLYDTSVFSGTAQGARNAGTYTLVSEAYSDQQGYNLNSIAGTLTINKATLNLSAVSDSKVYDGTTASNGAVTVSGLVAGDNISNLGQSFDSKNAGNRTLAVNGGYTVNDGNNGNNYTVMTSAANGTITPKALAVIGQAAQDKTYDGTANATLQGGSLSGVIGSDNVSLVTGTGAFSDKNAGTNKTVTVTGTGLGGTDAGNYTVASPTGLTATINKANLTVSAAAANKVYDGTTSATASLSDNRVAGDNLSEAYTGANFADKNAATGKQVTVSGISISGADAGNYNLVDSSTSATANISKASLILSAVADTKTYDGTAASKGAVTETGLVSGDSISNLSQSFDSKNAGNRTLSVIGGYGINDGNNGHNYTVATSTASGTISPRALNITASGQNKTYDGTTQATVTLADNRVVGDSLTDAYAAANFADKNAGTGKTVTVNGLAISGADAGNYTLANTTTTTTADIGRAALALAAVADSKTYDGTTASTGGVTETGLISGDSISGLSQSFDSRNAGNRNLSVNGNYTINDGNNGNNYTVTTHTASGTIGKASLTLSAISDSKVYDGTTASSGAVQEAGLVSGDTLTNLSQSFDSKNAGARALAVNSGYSINDGNNGNNYAVTANTAAGSITPKALTVTGQAATDKTYDATTNATLSGGNLAGVVGSDDVSLVSGTGTFSDKNVGANKAVAVTGSGLSGADAGNYTVANPAGLTANITPAALTLSAGADSKVYDGTAVSAGTVSVTGLMGSDSVSGVSQSFDSKNAGSRTLAVNGGYTVNDGNTGHNYTVATSSANGTITPRALDITATGQNKTYDGTTTATVTMADNRVAGDNLTDAYASASFADKNAGTGKTITVNGLSISGTDAGNYTVANTTTTTTADIGKAALALTAVADSKTYDGTDASTGAVAVNGLVGGDSINGVSQSFDSKNAGNRTLSVDGVYAINDGNNGNNYTVTTSTAAGTIAKANLNLSAVSDSKVYDGTTASNGAVAVSGLAAGDNISNLGQSFDSRNAGSRTLSVNGGYTVNDGNNGNNYNFATSTANGSITPKALTVTGQAAQDKTYDGTTNATLQGGSLSGVIGADNVNLLSGTGAFSDKNAGVNKSVTVAGTGLGGTDAGNYTVTDPTGLTATINKANLTVSATAANKVYDGTSSATASLTDNRVAGDNLSETYTGANFADKNAATGKQVTVSGISVSGTDAGNYNLVNPTASATADITPAALALSAVADSKVYDGTAASSGAATATGLVGGDSISGVSQSFDSKNAGSRTLSVNGGYTINDGNNGNNYTVTTSTASGMISKASLSLSAVSDTKVYDGTMASSGAVQQAGLVGGDSITGLSQSFDSKNVGQRTLSVNGGYVVNDGNNGENYTVTANTAAGAITPKGLTVTGQTAVDKTYDATTHAALNGGSLTGVVGGDSVNLVTGTGTFSDKNVGANKAVAVTGTGLSGSDAGNYTVADPAGLTASISPAALTVSASASNKVYDGTTAATAALTDNRFSGDSLSVSATSASFADKNAGNGKTVTVSGLSIGGADAGNYTLGSNTATTTANITPAPLTLGAVTDTKTYDGTVTSTGTVQVAGLAGGDTIGNTSQSFDSKNAGARTLAVNGGYTINDGNNGNNYTVTTTTADGRITKASLTLSAVSDSKVYDGTTVSQGAVQSSGLMVGDSLTGLSQVFDSKNAGDRTLSVNSYTINDGNNGQNYSVTTATASGSISKAQLVLGAVGDSKIFDNTTDSSAAVQISGLAAGDNVSNLSESFDKKTPGDRTLLVNDGYIVNDGNNGQNYTVTTTTAGGYIFPPGCDHTSCPK
jgi:trimeric autotransporter adhesin